MGLYPTRMSHYGGGSSQWFWVVSSWMSLSWMSLCILRTAADVCNVRIVNFSKSAINPWPDGALLSQLKKITFMQWKTLFRRHSRLISATGQTSCWCTAFHAKCFVSKGGDVEDDKFLGRRFCLIFVIFDRTASLDYILNLLLWSILRMLLHKRFISCFVTDSTTPLSDQGFLLRFSQNL